MTEEDVDVEVEELDVFNLILKLRQEKLFVNNERHNIQELNELINTKTNKLIQSAWLTTCQRLLLCQRDVNCQKIDSLLKSEFIDAKNALGFHPASKIASLLQLIHSQPKQIAIWLISRDNNSEDSLQYANLLQSIVSGLYACCIFPEDTKHMLYLLLELAKLEFENSENPHRTIKQRTCSFKNLYMLFHEVLQSAKIFLNAAFHMPIIQVLSYNDRFLDMDPDKTNMRYQCSDDRDFKSLQEYRTEVTETLAKFTNNFIQSILENIYNFPKSIAWLVHQVAKIINKNFGAKHANFLISELILNLYVCPVILDPEQYGICYTQVTDISRHNLIQVGQILQSLALHKFEPIEPKFKDLFKLVDKESFLSFFELVLETFEFTDEPPIQSSPELTRRIFLFTESELNCLVTFLQRVYVEPTQNDNRDVNVSIEEQLASLSLASAANDASPKSSRPNSNDAVDNIPKKINFFSIVGTKTPSKISPTSSDDLSLQKSTVLVFPMNEYQMEPIGFLPENKVVNMSQQPPIIKPDKLFIEADSNATQKQFASNFIDEGSIGNTSDNLEAISEAASNHSVASSLELETEDQNDNLSDMISANVSGRGTPNISGRDTPSSQVNENDDRVLLEPRPEAPPPQISRQTRSEIDDKFCKFEIKKLLEGDETISIISETWSTDVLASDNETIDAASESNRSGLQLVEEVPIANILDLSETQSESAWSTDVMTSDTERLTEVDTEDAGSVAQSDGDLRSECDENIIATAAQRRLSSVSNSYVSNSNYSSGSFEEYNSKKVDNNANNVANNFTEQIKTTITLTNYNKALINVAGPSGLGHKKEDSHVFMKPNRVTERPSEILLSNCSLNSSSSGSSSNSFENKNTHNEQWENKPWLNSSGSSLNVTLTPSESTSELSVLSASNLINPGNILHKKSATLMSTSSSSCNNNRSLKQSISTGAIPKSISFDMTADKGLVDDEQRRKSGSFFGKLKLGFRNRRGKSFKHHDDLLMMEQDDYTIESSPIKVNNNTEVSDDILAKYRSKPYIESNSSSPLKENGSDVTISKSPKDRSNNDDNDQLNSLIDIKKKLRLVLSNTSEIPHYIKAPSVTIKHKIESVLRLELGKAGKLKEWSNVARISEAIRCIHLLNDSSCLTLLQAMNDEISLRSAYIQYLIGARQQLLFSDMYLNSLQEQILHEKKECEKYLATVCVREFLAQKETIIASFCDEFKQLSLADEKCYCLQAFHNKLITLMSQSPTWHDVFLSRETDIKQILERYIMSKVYIYSIYPNGDGDRDRDSILQKHIEKLSKMISPDHKDLLIHRMFLRECPWLPAQDALKGLNACRTPSDKVNCVVHCAKCIMDLLSLAQNHGSAATADDFTPVLVYVIIKVNPEALLSTIEFVNSFLNNQLSGENLYWWTQFCAAVEFIKTMD